MRVHLGMYACTLTTYVYMHHSFICVYTYNISMPVHLQHIYACTLTTYLCVYTYNISIHASIFTFANRVCKNAKVPPEVSVLQCVSLCCSVLQCVAVCCSVLQCVAVCKNAKAPSELIHVCTCVCICKCVCDCRAIEVEFSQEQDRQTM